MYTFALFIVVVIPSICKGQHENYFGVGPKDPYIETGSSIKIECFTLCVSGKIFWTLDNKRIDESHSNTVNCTYTVLSLRNFTYRSATLQCHDGHTEQIIGGTTIRTYSKPSNISCMFYCNTREIHGPNVFSCEWTHQVDSSLKINYTLLCDKCPTQKEICNSSETTCKTQNSIVQSLLGRTTNFSVTVRATSASWEAYSSSQEFDGEKIVKIKSSDVTVTTLSDHLLVGWKIRTRTNRVYHCQLKYGKANNGTFEYINKTLKNMTEKGEERISNDKLESCSNYTFAVRCAVDGALWSDWNQKTVMTKLKKSDVKLHLWRKVSEVESSGFRKVHVMWTDIPSTCQDKFTYVIKQTPGEEHIAGVNSTLCGNSICDVNQDAHRINLIIFHNANQFVNDSVYVPAVGESLPQVTDIQTSTSKGGILVTWKAPVQPVEGYMIDYTHNGSHYHWKKTNNTNATLSGLLEKKRYNITVTPLFDDRTGHGTQALQICSMRGDPGNVKISVDPGVKSANVSWKVESVEECSGDVIEYTVFYSTQRGPQNNITVDSKKQHILLEDLNPKTQYHVYVEATALTGTSQSITRFFNPKTFDSDLIIGLGVCGGILIIVVLSLGLCCAIQWKKFKDKPVPNPGDSSVALWPNHDQGIRNFYPDSAVSESFDRVYPEEALRTSTSPPATGCNHNPVSDQTEVHADPPIVPAPDIQNDDQAEEQHQSPPGESTALISFESNPSSPYRGQSPVETLSPKTTKESKCVPVKQLEKTVYVTLDMYEQAQAR